MLLIIYRHVYLFISSLQYSWRLGILFGFRRRLLLYTDSEALTLLQAQIQRCLAGFAADLSRQLRHHIAGDKGQ